MLGVHFREVQTYGESKKVHDWRTVCDHFGKRQSYSEQKDYYY